MKSDTPLACDTTVFTPAEREDHMRKTTRLYRSVQDVRESDNGFEFTFPNETKVITGLAEFISKERLCCPFLEFTLKVTPKEEPITLLLSGPEGTREFLQAEFHEVFA